MAELADALDSKSSGEQPCRFESGQRHKSKGICFITLALSFYSGNVRAKAFAGKRSICIKMHILLFFHVQSHRLACSIEARCVKM